MCEKMYCITNKEKRTHNTTRHDATRTTQRTRARGKAKSVGHDD
jgi:hypothetical protein